MKGWRYMNCGHAVDPVIQANHRLHEATVLMRLSKEQETEHVCLRAKTAHGLLHDGGVGSTRTHTKKFRPGRD